MLEVSAAAICLRRLDGGVLRPTLAIDLACVVPAPGQELGHAQVHPDGSLSLPAQAAFSLFYGTHEFGVRAVKGVRIFHYALGGVPFDFAEKG